MSNGMSAKALLERERSEAFRPIPTFVQGFDEILGGGIKPGVITEIVGDSGLGKTTMCYQLCLDVQIPRILQGLESHSLFIDTENSFVVSRVKEMARAFVMHCNSVLPKGHTRHTPKLSESRLLSGINVVKCRNLSELGKIVCSLDEYIAENRKIKLIVIDSIAFPFYTQEEGFWERSKPLYEIGQVLHLLAEKYGIAVVLTNNVTTRFDPSGNEYFVPYLGESWYHIPNVRINLSWAIHLQCRVREAEIVKSSYSASSKILYRLTTAGIRE